MKFSPKKARREDRESRAERERKEKIRLVGQHRATVVAWELAKGVPGTLVEAHEIQKRCTELGVLHWANSEFSDYQKQVFEKYPLPKNHELTALDP